MRSLAVLAEQCVSQFKRSYLLSTPFRFLHLRPPTQRIGFYLPICDSIRSSSVEVRALGTNQTEKNAVSLGNQRRGIYRLQNATNGM